MSALPAKTDVVIVGAGPTGLTLGCVLAARRVPFVLIDRLAEGANTSRAAVVHARTLEVLEEIGVTDRLRAEGHVVPRFTVRDRDRALATIRFDGLPTRYPFTLMIPQNDTEAILLDLDALDHLTTKRLVARLHVAEVEVREHVRQLGEEPVAD